MQDKQVLLDAAKLLSKARLKVITLAKTVQCTPEYENKLISEIEANINAAIARLR